MFTACYERAACRSASDTENLLIGGLVVCGLSDHFDHGLASHQGVFSFAGTVAREKARALAERIGFFFPLPLLTFCLEQPSACDMGQLPLKFIRGRGGICLFPFAFFFGMFFL